MLTKIAHRKLARPPKQIWTASQKLAQLATVSYPQASVRCSIPWPQALKAFNGQLRPGQSCTKLPQKEFSSSPGVSDFSLTQE